MRRPQRGILCAGCPHRAAYIALKDASRRCRGRVICGDAGCAAVGELPPAAATCPGGAERLLPRYRVAVPDGGTPEHPAVETCIHIVPDTELAADGAVERLAGLAAEGRTTVLAVLASSRDFLARERIEWLGGRALALGASDVAVLDPFDTERCREVLCAQLGQPGVHGAVFASPCAQLQRGARPRAGGGRPLHVRGLPSLPPDHGLPRPLLRAARLPGRPRGVRRMRPVLRVLPGRGHRQPALRPERRDAAADPLRRGGDGPRRLTAAAETGPDA